MLFNFWGKKKKQQNNELYYNFDFPCEKIAERMNNSQYTQKWKNCSRQNGFPVFIIFNKIAKELFENNVYSFEEIDIEKYLNDTLEKAKLFAEENGEDFYYIAGKETDTENGICEFSSFDLQEDYFVLSATIPVENPWEVFQKIPFGNYNECPSPNIIAAFSKMAYEKFGAVPAVISADTIEFSVALPPSKEEALKLAWQIYTLCPDTVNQGHKSIYSLADCLTKSDVWTLWWD
ncbi:MAG: DUF4253 domain-containing protein [Ruminococcaceae bacterium]|nr:DUF4253 domain-containing protein [Oscillospiraceae bacterium]